jgi:hypothetical protein
MFKILILKLFLVPFLIYIVTIAGRRWGAAVAGWLSAFPIVSGPILLVITLEHGVDFGASAAEGTLLAVVAILVFSLGYAWATLRFAVLGSMLCALAVYALAVLGLKQIQLPQVVCYGLVLLSLLVVPKLFPQLPPEEIASSGSARGADLQWRMLAGAILVMSVTLTAAQLGARLSGFMAMFPVMSTVLVGFSHYHSGRVFAVTLLRGMVTGYFAFATFCLIIALLLKEYSISISFLLALACAVTIQLLAKRFLYAPVNKNPIPLTDLPKLR